MLNLMEASQSVSTFLLYFFLEDTEHSQLALSSVKLVDEYIQSLPGGLLVVPNVTLRPHCFDGKKYPSTVTHDPEIPHDAPAKELAKYEKALIESRAATGGTFDLRCKVQVIGRVDLSAMCFYGGGSGTSAYFSGGLLQLSKDQIQLTEVLFVLNRTESDQHSMDFDQDSEYQLRWKDHQIPEEVGE